MIQITKRRPAFTLLELAAVGACLAVVIAALPTALEGTRERARGAQCIANLGRIASASMTYAAADPGENAIPVAPSFLETPSSTMAIRLPMYAYGGKSGVGGPGSLTFFNSIYGSLAKMGPGLRPLNHVLYPGEYKPAETHGEHNRDTQLDMPSFRCPADDGFQGNHYQEWYNFQQVYPDRSSSYDYFGTSYNANLFWTGVTGNSCCVSSNSPFLRPVSTIPNPGNTLLYMENVGRFCWVHHDPAASKYGGPFGDILPMPEYPESLPGPEWHGDGWRFNAAFSDGHVAAIRMKSYVPVDPYPDELIGDCGQTYRCKWIMIRDRGWQIDTLPAPWIKTNHPVPSAGRPSQDGVGIIGWP